MKTNLTLILIAALPLAGCAQKCECRTQLSPIQSQDASIHYALGSKASLWEWDLHILRPVTTTITNWTTALTAQATDGVQFGEVVEKTTVQVKQHAGEWITVTLSSKKVRDICRSYRRADNYLFWDERTPGTHEETWRPEQTTTLWLDHDEIIRWNSATSTITNVIAQ